MKGKFKRVSVIVIVSLLILAVAGTVYYLFVYDKHKPRLYQPQMTYSFLQAEIERLEPIAENSYADNYSRLHCCRNFRKAHMRFGFRRGVCGNCKYFKGLPACHCRGFAELYFRLPRHGSSRNIEICQHLHFCGHGNPYCGAVYFVCNGQFFCGNACRNDLGFGNFHSFI